MKKLLLFTLILFFGQLVNAQCPLPNNNFKNFATFDLTPTVQGPAGTMTSTSTWGGDYHHVQVDSGETYLISLCRTNYAPEPGGGTSGWHPHPDTVGFDPSITLYQDTMPISSTFLSGPIVGFDDNGCGGSSNMPEITYTATFTGNLAFSIDSVGNCDKFVVDSCIVDVTWLFGCSNTTSSFSVTECVSYTVPSGDETYTAVGTYPVMDTIPNAEACDSIMTITVTILPPLIGSVTNTICNEDSIVVNGTTYNASNPSGTEVFTNIGPNNCDSTVTINLNVLPVLTGSVTNTICNEDSVVVNGTTYNASNPSGTEVFTNIGPNNCDSTVTINLNVLPVLTGSVTNTICNTDSVVVNGTTYNASNPSGTEVFTNVGPNNCDSTVTVNLTVDPAIDVTITNASPTLTANQTGATYQWVDCDNANAPIASETGQSFTATVNGNYAVEITVGSCTETSACENVTGVGIKETIQNTVSIYPNPTSGVFTINLGDHAKTMNYSISSIEGRIIEQGRTSQNIITIDLSDESKGIYLLKIENNTYKVLKQ